MVVEASAQPKYRQIAADLRAAIQVGRYAPGDRLPGENDLMRRYEVARMTARQALGVLMAEGVAVARKGVGVFVRDFRPIIRDGIERVSGRQWGDGRSIWSADVADRALQVTDVEVFEEDAPERVAEALALSAPARVWVRRRRFLLDDKPVLLATSYLPAELVAGSPITTPDPGPGGIYGRLKELGHPPVHFREDLRARMPQADEVAVLELPAGTPVVDVVRVAYAAEGRPVEVNEMTADASAYVFRYEFDA